MKEELKLEDKIYPIDISMRAAYNYIDRAYIFFKEKKDGFYIVEFEKKDNFNINEIVKNFKNDLLHEKVREKIAEKSKNIREIILARALHGLVLENKEISKENNKTKLENEEMFSLEGIGSYKDDNEKIEESWFKR